MTGCSFWSVFITQHVTRSMVARGFPSLTVVFINFVSKERTLTVKDKKEMNKKMKIMKVWSPHKMCMLYNKVFHYYNYNYFISN